jgi:thymidylate synthase
MRGYLDLLRNVVTNGVVKGDRTGTGVVSLFGAQIRYDLSDGFPLVTTKRVHWPSVVHELLWFIRGDTNVRYLQDKGVRIWDAWARDNGDLGPVYGKQWRSWLGADGRVVDQLTDVIRAIRETPDSRRLVVSAWNVGELGAMALPPCHAMFQFHVSNGRLDLQLYQRSGDLFLGVPFNIASYTLLLSMVAQVTGLRAGEFIHTLGDAHVYLNHLDQVALQLTRTPLARPRLRLDAVDDIRDFRMEHIHLDGYTPHPAIKGAVAV